MYKIAIYSILKIKRWLYKKPRIYLIRCVICGRAKRNCRRLITFVDRTPICRKCYDKETN